MLKIIKILILFVWSYTNAQAYTVNQIPFSAKPMTGTLVNAIDDAVYGPFNITFNFCFWGNVYSQMYIGSNGWVGFTGGQPIAFTSQGIPNTNFLVPRNCIMGPWYDINPGIAGGNPPTPIQYIYYQSYGTTPNRYMVISWNNAPLFQCTALRATQQIVLYEDGTIENSIIEKRVCASWASGTATQGLHNSTATQAIVVTGRNSTQWTVTNLPMFWETWKYIPTFAPCCPITNLNSN